MSRSNTTSSRFLLIGLALILTLIFSGCVTTEVPLDELFPPNVGSYLRVYGPAPDQETGVDMATYQGTDGEMITLRIKWVGVQQVPYALGELPSTATEVGYDLALGQREGTFFTFASEYHAAWGNGDWVFVLSATSQAARVDFLASYGY